ncbi:hypothetical protein [Paenibacillus puerhi]|uniref:hypothetical protein n=1 Tax=Paenibacillus puerhi TaxID=2692622 RepID=UPI00135C9830|nr:hypothetical protein [Paenibacillus puerhi]
MQRKVLCFLLAVIMPLFVLISNASAENGTPENSRALFNLEETWVEVSTGKVVNVVAKNDVPEFPITYSPEAWGPRYTAMVSLDNHYFRIRDLSHIRPTKYSYGYLEFFHHEKLDNRYVNYLSQIHLGQDTEGNWVLYDGLHFSIEAPRYTDNGMYKVYTKVTLSKFVEIN